MCRKRATSVPPIRPTSSLSRISSLTPRRATCHRSHWLIRCYWERPISRPTSTPPHDVRAGEYFISQIVSAVRGSPNWKDSVLFITYDEHGGSYDHVAPTVASQKGALNPDGINPGQCEDLSNPPASTQPGGGANCSISQTPGAHALCP